MRYPTVPTPPRPLAKVRVGATSDARWRDVPKNVKRIDSMERHHMTKRARKR